MNHRNSFDRDFKRHTRGIIGLSIFMLLLKLVVVGSLIFLGVLLINYIGEVGLKGIVEQIWNGLPKK